jgi:hypothetical protein
MIEPKLPSNQQMINLSEANQRIAKSCSEPKKSEKVQIYP